MGTLSTIWHSLDEGFFMFWQTLWALVLGFVLSGAVQALVSRRAMVRTMGDHGPAAITRASLFGMASSSCSYAASALARSLFDRGADFTTAIVFMVASTNLVIELGLVMWLLIGWQLAAAEFLGGAIMIVLLAALLPKAASASLLETTRAHRDDAQAEPEDSEPDAGFRARLQDPARRRAAARYTLSDLSMLRREIVIGFVVAGFLAVGVPTRVWSAVFIHGHGALTAIENALVGPAVAMVSFVCSIGNVPLAAALWQRGVSFGGVIAFVFADLLSLPLVLIYRKLYGGRLTLRLVAVLWFAMSSAGLLTEVVMRALGGIPGHRPRLVAAEHFAWNHTTVLNIIALVGFALVVRAGRGARADDGGSPYAIDPVCGMQVERAHAPASYGDGVTQVYFCSTRCRDHYVTDRETVA
ncbi:MAG TPA: permease [Mycobacteriales bacterium]|nr:permease [Mycobacteriales bacterium]